MNAKQQIKLIAEYSRADLNEIVLAEIALECKDMDIQRFISFIRESLDRTELQYVPSGIERFMKFSKMYKQEINKDRELEAMTQSQLLENKLYEIVASLEKELRGKKSKTMPNLHNGSTLLHIV